MSSRCGISHSFSAYGLERCLDAFRLLCFLVSLSSPFFFCSICVKSVCVLAFQSAPREDREAHGSCAKGHSITLQCLSGHIVYAWGHICGRKERRCIPQKTLWGVLERTLMRVLKEVQRACEYTLCVFSLCWWVCGCVVEGVSSRRYYNLQVRWRPHPLVFTVSANCCPGGLPVECCSLISWSRFSTHIQKSCISCVCIWANQFTTR